METENIHPASENNMDKKTMTRAEALKKAGKLTLAAGAMLVLLNTPEKAMAASGGGPIYPDPIGGSGA